MFLKFTRNEEASWPTCWPTSWAVAVVVAISLAMSVPAAAKTFKIATVSPDGLGWMKKMRTGAKEIGQLTEGRVKFKIYPGGVQGDDFTVLRKMRIGQLQGGAVASSSLTRFYPDLQVYNLPLQFQDAEEVDYVRTRMDERIIDGLSDNGIVSFNLTETGFAYILSKEPVRSLADLKKIKAWVPDGDPIAARLIESFGISPIPLYITDVLAGLQTGLIDAVAVPPIVALALQWHNHVSYVTDLPLIYTYSMLAMDKKAFDRIDEPDQAIVRQVMNRVFTEVDLDNRKDNKKAFAALLTQGLQEVRPNELDRAAWQAKAEESITELVNSGGITMDSVEVLKSHLDDARSAALVEK